MGHKELLVDLGQPVPIIDVYSHKVDLSKLAYVPLRSPYAYPPCFVPIFEYGTAPSYRGVLSHYFVSRSMTYVNLLAHQGFFLYEYARTSEQFLMRLFVELVSLEEDWNEVVAQASMVWKIDDARSVFELWQEKEDDCFKEHSSFRANQPYTPLFCHSEYSGDFPSPDLNFQSLESYCGVEMEEYRDRMVVESAPGWLTASRQKPVFDHLYQKRDFAGCWMSVNSRGWEWSELRNAVDRLAKEVEDKKLHLQAEEWLSHNHESFIEYF